MVYFECSALKEKRRKGVMLKTKDIYIEVLSSIVIMLLVVLALFNKNRIDYIYLSFICILIFKFYIERFRK